MASPHDLERHCRICGGFLHKRRKRGTEYECSLHSHSLTKTFGVDVTADIPSVHPLKFCDRCYACVRRQDSADAQGLPYNHSTTVFIWEKHTDKECKVRSTLQQTIN